MDTEGSSFYLEDPLSWASPSSCPEGWVEFPVENAPGGILPEKLADRPTVVGTLSGEVSPSAADLVMPDHSSFTAGNLHAYADRWGRVCSKSPVGQQVVQWAREGVDVRDFFVPFKGEFMGRHYDSSEPPRAEFRNHALPSELSEFVTKEVARELRVGAITRWGKVGEVEPPHLVLPIGVEPTKPRKLNDGRFINLWCKDLPFEFEGLHMIPAVFDKGEYAFNVDHVSGYFHISLTEDSKKFFGFCWEGVYYVYNVLNFGWKPAPYIYTCFSGETAGFLRRLSVRNLFLLDDSFGGPLHRVSAGAPDSEKRAASNAAVFVVVSIMVALGYYVHPVKSVLIPTRRIRWLGLDVDFVTGEFAVPADKAEAICALIRVVLAETAVSFKTLERVVGKLGSLALAAPGILLKMRRMYAALTAAKAGSAGSPPASMQIPLSGPLKDELEECLALPFWTVSVAPWKSPEHLTVVVSAPLLVGPAPEEGPARPLVTAGATSLWRASVSFGHPTRGAGSFGLGVRAPQSWADGPRLGVDDVGDFVVLILEEAVRRSGAQNCFVTMALHLAWRPATVLSSDLSYSGGGAARAARVFATVSKAKILVKVLAIPADSVAARRKDERKNYRLCPKLFHAGVVSRFGAVLCDLMASDENAQRARLSEEGGGAVVAGLEHYTRWPSAGSAGVNVFSQSLSERPGLYANPVFATLLPFFHLLRHQRASAVVVVPGWDGAVPGGAWWPLLGESSTEWFLLAPRGTPGVFLRMSDLGDWAPAGPLPWDLWVFRFSGRTV